MSAVRIGAIILLAAASLVGGCDNRKEPVFQGWVEAEMIFVGPDEGRLTRILIPELETPASEEWRYLVARPHPWRRQLHVKGRRLLAASESLARTR